MTTVATEDQEQPNPSHERAARILDVTPGCRTSSGPAETRSAPKGRTYDRSRPSRSKHQIVLAIRGRPHMRWRSPVSCHILGNRRLTYINAELKEFAVDPGSAHNGLARLMSRINWRISSGTFGLPPRERDLHRRNKRNPARCQEDDRLRLDD